MMNDFKTFKQFVNESGDWTSSTNRVSQTNSLKQAYPDAEDDEDQDKYNPSKINKGAAKVAGSNVTFVSKKKKTPGNSIDTFSNRKSNRKNKYLTTEGGLGDSQVAGQRVYTQNVDKSKQGYQDSMYYGDEDVDDHGPECDCPDCTSSFD